jgi:hypothetical protein
MTPMLGDIGWEQATCLKPEALFSKSFWTFVNILFHLLPSSIAIWLKKKEYKYSFRGK